MGWGQPLARAYINVSYFGGVHKEIQFNTCIAPWPTGVGLYKIFVYFGVHEATILSSPHPPALPTLMQYYCTIIGQYSTPLPIIRVYAKHHTILVITISC